MNGDSDARNPEKQGKLGRRVGESFTPWEQISIDRKERLSGVAELICEAARSGDFVTAKEYWKNARFEDPVGANSAFYENFNVKIADSYLSYANNEMSRIKWGVPILGFSELEIAISNAEHYDPQHPMLGFARARLLIRKANNIGSYDSSSCLSAARQIISELRHRMKSDEKLQNDNYKDKLSILRGEYEFVSNSVQEIRNKGAFAGLTFLIGALIGVPGVIFGMTNDHLPTVCCSLVILVIGLIASAVQDDVDVSLRHDTG